MVVGPEDKNTMKTALPSPHATPAPARALVLAAATGAALLSAALLAGCATQAPDVVTQPRPLNLQIQYPPQAQRREATGTVRVRVAYDASGTVQDVRVLQSSGHPDLDAEALRATRAMRVQPGTRNNVPQPGALALPVRFHLE